MTWLHFWKPWWLKRRKMKMDEILLENPQINGAYWWHVHWKLMNLREYTPRKLTFSHQQNGWLEANSFPFGLSYSKPIFQVQTAVRFSGRASPTDHFPKVGNFKLSFDFRRIFFPKQDTIVFWNKSTTTQLLKLGSYVYIYMCLSP